MIHVLVTMEVKDFTQLAAFESKAVQVMHYHGGVMVRAFEVKRYDDGTGQEVHLLEFPSLEAFDEYRSNPLLLEYAELRCKAIDSTVVVISSVSKDYSEK